MPDRRTRRTALRGVGVALVVGAALAVIAADDPEHTAGAIGTPPATSATPRPPAPPRADPAPSPFTATAPRGPVDPATWPAAVTIASLAVDAPVQPIGVNVEGALIVPSSPMDVGWYQRGAVPGEPGVAILTSHLDTRREGRGVFAGLTRLDVGAGIVTRSGDGSEQRWRVTARTQHAKDALPDRLFVRSGSPVLALVTCGGPFDPTARSYRDNVIVWAEPAG